VGCCQGEPTTVWSRRADNRRRTKTIAEDDPHGRAGRVSGGLGINYRGRRRGVGLHRQHGGRKSRGQWRVGENLAGVTIPIRSSARWDCIGQAKRLALRNPMGIPWR